MRDFAPALVAVLVAACALPPATGVAATAPKLRAAHRQALERAIATDGRAVALVSLDERDVHLHKPLVDRARLVEVRAIEDAWERTLDGAHVNVRARLASVPSVVVDVDGDGLRALAAHRLVRAIVPDERTHALDDFSAPLIRADREIAMGHDGDGVGVAVLDSGINTGHVDFQGALLGSGFHALNQGQDVGAGGIEDDDGHGSNVAGIVASRGKAAPSGIAPAAGLVVVRVITSAGGWASDWALGLDWVVTHRDDFAVPVRIINMSIGTYAVYAGCPCDDASPPLAEAAEAAVASGILVIAATGNEGRTDAMTAPGCFSSVLAVGAAYSTDVGRFPPSGTYRNMFGSEFAACADTTKARELACFTNRDSCLAIVAPGAPIQSDWKGPSSTARSTYYGTSQATPHVAGVAADLAAAYPSLRPADLVDALLASQQPEIVDPSVAGASYPFLDALDADARAACLASCNAGPCEIARCDGGGACTKSPSPVGDRCGAPTCKAGVETSGRCDGAGQCASASVPCGAYACDVSGSECLTRCTVDGDCAGGTPCMLGAGGVGICAPPVAPDMTTDAGAGATGCGCAVGQHERGGAGLGLLLALAAILRRPLRRRRRRRPRRASSRRTTS